MAAARRRYERQARLDDFQRRAREWRRSLEQRDFLPAVRDAMRASEGTWVADLGAHLDAVESWLDATDLLKHPELVLPVLPDPKPDDLKPFLDGWSPRGPDSLGG